MLRGRQCDLGGRIIQFWIAPNLAEHITRTSARLGSAMRISTRISRETGTFSPLKDTQGRLLHSPSPTARRCSEKQRACGGFMG